MPKRIFLLMGPLVAGLMILFLDVSPAHPEIIRMAAIVVWMALWWLTEAVPLPVTALLPVVFYPLFGIMSAQDVAPQYFNHIIFLFMGGFMIAIAMERWELHRRIALSIIHWVGLGRRRLLFGFMLATAFLSMWISNTATTMMMVPIALAVVQNMGEPDDEAINSDSNSTCFYGIGLFLAIAYAANIGGFATLIGTPPNLAFMGIFQEQFPNAPEITFSQWLLFALPISVALLVLVWGYLTLRFVSTSSIAPTPKEMESSEEANQTFFQRQYQGLGPMSREEKIVAGIFTVTALLWMTRSGGLGLSGWGIYLPQANDSTVAMAMALLLFIIPARSGCRLLCWEDLKDFPWGILILFGGGLALAEGFSESGLSLWLGNHLLALGNFPPLALVFASTSAMAFLTELTSNTPSTQMFLPILASICRSTGIHPLLLMVPTTLAASCAFMLPVATPPNAIVFGTRRVPIREMAKTGLVVNLIAIVVVTLMSFFLIKPIFGPVFGAQLDTLPTWVSEASIESQG